MRMLWTTKGVCYLLEEGDVVFSNARTTTIQRPDGFIHHLSGAIKKISQTGEWAQLEPKAEEEEKDAGLGMWELKHSLLEGPDGEAKFVEIPYMSKQQARPVAEHPTEHTICPESEQKMIEVMLQDIEQRMVCAAFGLPKDWPFVGDDCEEEPQAPPQPEEELPCCCTEEQYQQGVSFGQGFSDTCPYHQQWRANRKKGMGL